MATLTTTPTFRETQRPNQWWVFLIVAAVAALGWYGFVQQILLGRPFGNHPAPDWAVWLTWAAFGLLFPLGLATIHMTTEVTGGTLVVTYVPFFRRRIGLDEIDSAEAVTYRPIWDYGGWGIRWSWARGTAYNVRGSRGVQLVLRGGKRLLIGSQKPEELAGAIHAGRAGGL